MERVLPQVFCLMSCNSSACLKINSFMALGGLLLGPSFTIPHLLCFTSSSLKILLDRKYKSKIIVIVFFFGSSLMFAICSKEWTYSFLFYLSVSEYSFKKPCVCVANSHAGNP